MASASTSVDPLSPASGTERLDLIDALRGFALAGVLLVNLGAFSLYFFLDDQTRAALPTAGFDRIARLLKAVFADRKAMTLFALLFGLGFALQLERAKARGATGLRVFMQRICVLLVFGAVHAYLLWWGDILLMYALMALLLVAFRHASERTLILGGLFIALLLPPLLTPWVDPLVARLPAREEMFARTLQAFSGPSWAAALADNVAFANWTYRAWWDDWCFIFGRFLLGYWAGRICLFHDPAAHRVLLRRLFVVALAIGGTATALEIAAGANMMGPAQVEGAGAIATAAFHRAGALGLGIAYACGFALLCSCRRDGDPACRCWRRWDAWR